MAVLYLGGEQYPFQSCEVLVAEILDEVMKDGKCDFVVNVAARLPMAFICEIGVWTT